MMLSDEALEALACIMGHMEKLGAVPVELVLLVMLGKLEGGHRLVGLLTGGQALGKSRERGCEGVGESSRVGLLLGQVG